MISQSRRGTRWSMRRFISGGVVGALVVALTLAGCGPTGPYWQTLDTSQNDTIVSLAQDPSQTKILYAGANHGVIYRERTNGVSTPVNGDGLPPSAQTNALLPDPHTPGVVYAATTSGLFVTADDGNNWGPRGSGLPRDDVLTAIAFGASGAGGTLLVGTSQHGVYISGDQGHTWSHVDAGLPSGAAINTLFHDSTAQAVFAGLDGGGMYASTDGGQTWAHRTADLAPNSTVYAFAETPSKGINPSGPTLYAGTSHGLYASADSGQTWTQRGITSGLPSGTVQALAASPQSAGVLYAGLGSTVYSTSDGGAHWAILAPGLSHTVTSLVVAIPPDGKPVIYAGAGQLQRFPAIGGSGNALLNTIIAWVFIILLFGVGLYVIFRARRQMNESARHMRDRLTPPNRPQI